MHMELLSMYTCTSCYLLLSCRDKMGKLKAPGTMLAMAHRVAPQVLPGMFMQAVCMRQDYYLRTQHRYHLS